MDEKYDLTPKSNAYKESQSDHPEKAVTGEVVRKNKSVGKKFREVFFAEDARTVRNYILSNVLVPAIKDTVRDIIVNAIDISFGGTGTRRTGGTTTTYVNYSGYSGKNSSNSRVSYLDRDRRSHDIDTIYFASRGDAEEVLIDLLESIERYDRGFVRVSDFYHLAGESSNWADDQWGWSDLSDARIAGPARINGQAKYWIDFPRPIPKPVGK